MFKKEAALLGLLLFYLKDFIKSVTDKFS